MRLFLAINPPDEVRTAIGRDVASLVASAPDVAWVRAELLHVTMRFFGEREVAEADSIAHLARRVAATASPVDVRLGGVGAFPNFRRPRVVWLGMRNPDPVTTLAQRLDDALADAGEPRPDRPFRPHLTLGRVKKEMPPPAAAALERHARGLGVDLRFRMDHLHLMRSELSSRGPAYSVVAAIPLGTP